MKTLHFDCFAGISGDMALGAFVALGVEKEYLITELQKLGISGWELNFTQEERCGIYGTKANVVLHHHHSSEHHHEHNHWRDIRSLIKNSCITDSAKEIALNIFERIAIAEAEVHNKPVEEVAFHEVGAVDSIIDIVGAAICLDCLKPERITASSVELGGGFVHCAHGVLPVPAPATLIILKGKPVKTSGFDKEMTTPTGAAILASIVNEWTDSGAFTELNTAYGIGERKFEKPNVLRVSWRETERNENIVENLTLLETSVDDMNGEELSFLMDKLFEGKALDVNFIPCTMKKSRPAIIISVLCSPQDSAHVQDIIFKHSSSIGIKEFPVRRTSLRREENETTIDGVSIREKNIFFNDNKLRTKVEFESKAEYARKFGISLAEVQRKINEQRT